jgi:hypothetical protein
MDKIKIRQAILTRIRMFPGIKFASIFDSYVKDLCGHHPTGFRVADRALQELRRNGIIKYRNGWYLK